MLRRKRLQRSAALQLPRPLVSLEDYGHACVSEAARVCHRGAATPSPPLLRHFVLLGSPLFGHRLVAWLPNSHVRCLLCLVFGSYFRFVRTPPLSRLEKKMRKSFVSISSWSHKFFSFVTGVADLRVKSLALQNLRPCPVVVRHPFGCGGVLFCCCPVMFSTGLGLYFASSFNFLVRRVVARGLCEC